MNYQQQRHVQNLRGLKLHAIAQCYEVMAVKQRLHNTQIADLSEFVFGHRSASADVILAHLKRQKEQPAPRVTGPEFQFDEGEPDGKYPARKKKGNRK